MPAKKNRGSKPASDGNRRGGGSRGRKSPGPYDAGENLQKPYEGYDEKRTSFNTEYEKDFDVDENDTGQRHDEYNEFRKKTGIQARNSK